MSALLEACCACWESMRPGADMVLCNGHQSVHTGNCIAVLPSWLRGVLLVFASSQEPSVWLQRACCAFCWCCLLFLFAESDYFEVLHKRVVWLLGG